jgi:hypothetical protein
MGSRYGWSMDRLGAYRKSRSRWIALARNALGAETSSRANLGDYIYGFGEEE